MRMIPTTPEEKTAAVKSLRKEAYRLGKTEGRAEGKAEGKAEGRRQALLAVVAWRLPTVVLRCVKPLIELSIFILSRPGVRSVACCSRRPSAPSEARALS